MEVNETGSLEPKRMDAPAHIKKKKRNITRFDPQFDIKFAKT